MMEPERPKVDRAVLAFVKSEAPHPADFTIRADGVGGETQSGVGEERLYPHNLLADARRLPSMKIISDVF